jgi:hypothetical protein
MIWEAIAGLAALRPRSSPLRGRFAITFLLPDIRPSGQRVRRSRAGLAGSPASAPSHFQNLSTPPEELTRRTRRGRSGIDPE